MLVNATEMLIKARDGHYGVPQFNIRWKGKPLQKQDKCGKIASTCET